MISNNANYQRSSSTRFCNGALSCLLHVVGILLLGACTLGEVPPSNITPIPLIPTGQAVGIVPAGTQYANPPGQVTALAQIAITIVDFYFHPRNTINAGECTTLSWKVTGILAESGIEVYIDGKLVPPTGDRQHCTCASETHYLWVLDQNHTIIAYSPTFLYIREGTNCNNQQSFDVTKAPGIDQTTVEPTPDDIGPFTSHESVVFDDACKIIGGAYIYDPSGVAQAKFGFNLNNQGWRWIWMYNETNPPISLASGLESWISEAGIPVMEGIGTPVGQIDWQVWAKDKLGNESYSTARGSDYNGCTISMNFDPE